MDEANMPSDYFLSSDHAEVITKLQEIIAWADSHTFYTPKAKQKFLRMDKADIYLVAFAAVAPRRMDYSIHGTSCAKKCWRDKTP